MSTFEAFIFGLLQGITEFLPISSSAHLKLAKLLFGIENSEAQVIFDLMCHLGTLVAVLAFFRRDIYSLFTKEKKKLALLCIATLPLIPCYFLLKPVRDWASAPQFLGLCLIVTSLILFLGEKWRLKERKTSTFKHGVQEALWIGTLQAGALIPGISRSASTISCARVLGWEVDESVRFSFLLSIPTIMGGNCLELLKIAFFTQGPLEIAVNACLIGFFTSCLAGLTMVRFALAVLQKGNLKPFAWYCLLFGFFVTIYLNLLRG